MILAAPLVIPFAEAVGISIATLGMAKAADMVNDYIQENPEESMKILSTIVPNIGIGQIFANKEDSGEDNDSEDVAPEDRTKAERAAEMKKRFKEGKGDKREIGKKAYEEVIKPAKDMEELFKGEERIDGSIEEVGNPKFDFTKFYKNRRRKADGGAIGIEVLFEEKNPRQGLFMGGSPLDGQALSIYNSMNAYGFDDQAIADALQEQGLYTPGGSTPDTPDTTIQPVGFQGSNDGPYAGQVVDQTNYGFNKKNYAPGEKLEINPAAFGVSFPDQPSGPKREGIINQAIDSFTSLPTRSLSSFASPTTGGNIVGPAEQGFMGQTLDIDPAGRTREEIRSLYDNYNRFLGRTSNFADARQKGKAGEVLGNIVGFASGIPFLGKGINKLTDVFGPKGDKSLQSKYTVDNAGFGNTGARDEFGLATFNKKDGFLGLTGNTTRDYTDRMNERLGELTDFFGSRIEGFDINNLDDATLDKMSKINGFYTKQIQAYKQRLATENINRNTQDAIKAQAEAKKKEEAAFQAQLNETQRQQRMSDLQRVERAYREDTGGRGGSYATGESGVQSDGSYNDPFDPGGGEKDGGFIDGYNRRKYSQGGLATMFKEKR